MCREKPHPQNVVSSAFGSPPHAWRKGHEFHQLSHLNRLHAQSRRRSEYRDITRSAALLPALARPAHLAASRRSIPQRNRKARATLPYRRARSPGGSIPSPSRTSSKVRNRRFASASRKARYHNRHAASQRRARPTLPTSFLRYKAFIGTPKSFQGGGVYFSRVGRHRLFRKRSFEH